MMIIILWILLTLSIVTISTIIAKKYGVEFIIAAYVAIIITANITASKAVSFGFFVADAGTIIYSTSFLLTDILSEFYGKKIARKAVFAGLFANIIMVVSVFIAVQWKPASFYEYQDQFTLILGNTGRIVFASLIAFTISQNYDVWIYHILKKITKNKYLWFRNNISTITSQLLDTCIFVTIAFLGVFPVLPMMIGQIVVKSIIAIFDTPFMYLMNWIHKK